jgi:hypothetical protein
MFQPFTYPDSPHTRKHGPAGYVEDRSFKPWLRDEFEFRCVFCLLRERWSPLGDESFGLEHVAPRSRAPNLERVYDNLVYACSTCNAAKKDKELPLDPCHEGYGRHLRVRADGVVEHFTRTGAQLIRRLNLNRDLLQQLRRDMLWMIERATANPNGDLAVYLRSLMAYPVDLPDLDALRPPDGNTRPDGVRDSCFARRERGELPATY